MGTIAHDALFQSCQRLLRLGRESKIYTTCEGWEEVSLLLLDAQAAVELAGGIARPAPLPLMIDAPDTIMAKPYDRRKDA